MMLIIQDDQKISPIRDVTIHEAATIMIAATISSLIGTIFAGFISQYTCVFYGQQGYHKFV